MQDPLTVIVRITEALALLVLGTGTIMLAVFLARLKRSLDRMDRALARIADEAGPVLDRARAVGENVNYIVMSVRRDVEKASDTVAGAQERIENALDAAEARVRELGALIDVIQEEVEDTVLSATAALRGLRSGARVLSSRDNEEASSDEHAGD